MTEEEIWKEIPDFPDYQISNLGRVKSLWHGKERILKQNKSGSGYLTVSLCNKSKKKTFNIHKLLGIAFLGFPENVDHINGDPTDNRLENLRPCSCSENNRNVRIKPNSTTGFPGVCFNKVAKKYQAQIRFDGKRKHLGYFNTREEAFIAYREANLKLFGEFSPFVCRDDFRALSEQVGALEGDV